MAYLDLEHETLLDLMVNIIPVGILLGMEVLFFVFNPWGWDLWIVFWMHFLTLFPLALLLVLTYVSGRVIQHDEGKTGEIQAEDGSMDADQSDEPPRLSLAYWLGD